MNSSPTLPILAILALLATSGHAQSPSPSEAFAPAGTLPKYAPNRQFDLQHTRLDLTIDLAKNRFRGTATLTLAPLNDGLRRVTLDSTRLEIRRVRLGETTLTHRTRDEVLEIDLERAYREGEPITVAIDYESAAAAGHEGRIFENGGLAFIGPFPDYPKRRQVWSHGQPRFNHRWFPTWDEPDDKATSEVIATVPGGFTAVSNGERVEVRENRDGTRTFHYRQKQPHSTYLVTLAVGEFDERREEWDGIPILYYVPAGQGALAAPTFRQTPDMVRFFSERVGVRYPGEKYAQVTAYDFGGGMENTSATTMLEGILRDEIAAADGDSNGLIAHELAHQWFGDLITCRDWAHIWLNEGFATFFDAVYQEQWKGRDDYLLQMHGNAQSYLGEARRYRRPMVTHLYTDSGRMFDSHTYPRGAWVLHMLRRYLGDDAFWKGIRRYTRAFQYRSVETNDFQRAMEEATGRSLGDFFDQWVYRPGHPELKVAWSWDEETKSARITVNQTQKTSDGTPVYRMPLKVAFDVGGTIESFPLELAKADGEFTYRLAERPRMVLFDSEHALLKELDFPHPTAEWAYQLAHGIDALHRRLAAEALGKVTNEESAVTALIEALRSDVHASVRVSAARALGPVKTAGAMEALRAAALGGELRVRIAAVQSLGRRKSDASLSPLFERVFQSEKSYALRQAALEALAGIDAKKQWPALTRALALPSHRETLRATALHLMGESADPRAVKPCLEWSAPGKPLRPRIAALDALAKVGKGRSDVRERLLQAIAHPYSRIRDAALRALRERAEQATIAPLEKLRDDEPNKDRREALRGLIDDIRGGAARQQENARLRQDLQRVQEEQRELERRVEELEGKRKRP